MSSAPRGLAPREGLELELMKMCRAGPPLEPRRRPQAGKSGDPHSQNADNYRSSYNISRTHHLTRLTIRLTHVVWEERSIGTAYPSN